MRTKYTLNHLKGKQGSSLKVCDEKENEGHAVQGSSWRDGVTSQIAICAVGSTEPPVAVSCSPSSRLPLTRLPWAIVQLPLPTLESLLSNRSSSSRIPQVIQHHQGSRFLMPSVVGGKGPSPMLHPIDDRPPLLFPSHLLECPTERALLAPTVLPPPRLLVGSELCPSPPSGCSALLFPRPTHHEGSHFFPRALLYLIGHLLQAAGVPFLWFTPQ